jgi:hypothetical protein
MPSVPSVSLYVTRGDEVNAAKIRSTRSRVAFERYPRRMRANVTGQMVEGRRPRPSTMLI